MLSVVLRDGNQNSLSDAGCAVLNAVAAGEGAYMNVLINLAGLSRDGREGAFRKKLHDESERAVARLRKTASALTEDTFAKLKSGLKDSSGVLA